jgi:hypothetical protein
LYTQLYPGVQLYYLAELIPDPTREYLYEGMIDMDLTCSPRIKVKFTHFIAALDVSIFSLICETHSANLTKVRLQYAGL